ncbi:MAG: tRNA preQ1(34) S-adenosylmethionine ribosyltransferase-isomerase QueA [Dehalococcoidia bacterium]|nr:tRNA preQ1(34) S-adenosylmethionine ribosyltransferase-isomerase QueA [Dehalococcoidia bacterium]
MKTSDFAYDLPPELIAQTPIEPRDHSRLMVLNRKDGAIEHRRFFEITDYLNPGDVLVFNESRVIPARLHGCKPDTGAKVELLLLRQIETCTWETLLKPARRLKPGARIELGDGTDLVGAEVVEHTPSGTGIVRFDREPVLERVGQVPLPPYIHTPLADPERYQTVYARVKGSVAAPTAGLHFTPELLERIRQKGVEAAFVTLHVSWDTFTPVRVEDPREHRLHSEFGELSPEVASQLRKAKAEGRRVIAVGTTATRLLETSASGDGTIQPFCGMTGFYILPGHQFRAVDALITNFHLPCSTLLMLVSAFAGRDFILRAYQEAIKERYRFFSFGDAMMVM